MAELPGKVFTSLAKDLIKTYFDEQWEYQRMDVKAKIQELASNLTKIKALIAVAQEMEIKEPNLLDWLSEIKNAIYDAEYVMDVFEYQRLKNEITTEVVEGKWKEKVSRVFKSSLACCSKLPTDAVVVAKRLLFADEDRNDLLEFVKKIEYLVNDMDHFSSLSQLHLAIQNQQTVSADGGAESRETTSVSVEHKLFGRNEEEKQLLELLLQSLGVTGETTNFDVVSVVGVGGVGKTTLAQFAYNHQRLDGKFDVKAWVCVSTNFDIKSLTKHIIEDAKIEKPDDYSSLDTLGRIQEVLMKGLKSKRFLIVMDDVWEDMQQDKWERICVPFCNGKEGSKILVTSRNRDVAKAMGAEENRQINLSRLQTEFFWEFFQCCAFRKKRPENYQQLEQIGKVIALQLGGLPLAAKTVGGLLYANFDIDHWRVVLNSKKWKEDTKVIPALKLSYHHLPKHLKKCFAYCCLFPKDFKYKAQTLVDIWIALDCVRPEDKNRRLVDIFKIYIKELVSRCFLNVYNADDDTYVIHDLLHDLAEEIVGDELYRVEDEESLSKEISLHHYVRHLYVKSTTQYSLDSVLQKLHIAPKQLRSLVFYCKKSVEEVELKLSEETIQKLKGLRLFLFYCSDDDDISDEKLQIWENLGDMLHLRCASLHFGNQYSIFVNIIIPVSLWKLNQLEIFRATSFQMENFDHLPNLISLRRIGWYDRNFNKINTSHLGRLKNLEAVPGNTFTVDEKEGNDIGQLGELNKIEGELILEVQMKLDEAEARKANLNSKQYLTQLVIKETCKGNFAAIAIEALHPHQNLQKLKIYGIKSITVTPEWLTMLSNLTGLALCNLPKLQGLPADLGCHLLYLKGLYLCSLPSLKRINVVLASRPVFPSLTYVELFNLENLEGWCPESSNQRSPKYFPLLNIVQISECPKLLMRGGSLPNCTIFPFPSPNCSIRLELVSRGYEFGEYFIDPEFKAEEEIKFKMVIDVKSLLLAATYDNYDPKISILFSRVKEMIIYGMDLFAGLSQKFSSLETLILNNCVAGLSLDEMIISPSKDEMNVSPGGLSHKFSLLETLVIESCYNLESLDKFAHHLPPANRFIIRRTEKLRFVSAANNLQAILSSSLSLIIDQCWDLESLIEHNIDSNTHNHISNIKTLTITRCYKLKSLFLPAQISIKTLTLLDCWSLKFMFLSTVFPSLETLLIEHCYELESLTDDSNKLPPSINTLIIKCCPKLKLSADILQMFSCIHTIQIQGCKEIKSLVVPAASPIKTFIIKECRKLTSVSLETLIETLIIERCVELESLSNNEMVKDSNEFPPISINTLIIIECNKLKVSIGILQMLPSIHNRMIKDCEEIEKQLEEANIGLQESSFDVMIEDSWGSDTEGS